VTLNKSREIDEENSTVHAFPPLSIGEIDPERLVTAYERMATYMELSLDTYILTFKEMFGEPNASEVLEDSFFRNFNFSTLTIYEE
jgi:hypothetical protein